MKSLSAQILDTMGIVPNFPKPGVMFRDITPLLADARLFKQTVALIGQVALAQDADVIVGVESRGFILAAAAAVLVDKPLILMRKPGKLPRETVEYDYGLEYGTDRLCIHKTDIKPGDRVSIVDDVLATGGTANAASFLVRSLGGIPSHIFLLELKDLVKAPVTDPYSALISL